MIYRFSRKKVGDADRRIPSSSHYILNNLTIHTRLRPSLPDLMNGSLLWNTSGVDCACV